MILSASDILCRTFTSSLVVKDNATSLDLPSNLVVADPNVLRPLPTPAVKIEDFLFPPLHVAESIEVKSFSANPTALATIPTTALEKKMFEVPIRKDIVLNLIRYIRNARRQPKKTKRMSEIRGSNKKPRPQKGTGVGQVGHRRNSAWRGGQKAHGPVLRDYSISLNKKVRALGMMMTVVAKYREGNLHIFENFALETHRTKDLKNILTAHGLADSLSILVDAELNENFKLASNNLPKVNALELRVSLSLMCCRTITNFFSLQLFLLPSSWMPMKL
jgi:large subunit ribosomal protein L4